MLICMIDVRNSMENYLNIYFLIKLCNVENIFSTYTLFYFIYTINKEEFINNQSEF